MKNLTSKLASILMSSILFFSVFSVPAASSVIADQTDTDADVEEETRPGVYGFVDRLYSVCLDREPDEAGVDYWASELLERRATGISCASGFIFSDEFQNKHCSKENYVGYMYDAFFGRTPADSEVEYWVNQMNSGMSRKTVFSGFANSSEFAYICETYDVVRGDYFPQYDLNQTVQVNLFIDRMYTNVLERTCDAEGMTYWTQELLAQRLTGAGVAEGFIFSSEFAGRHLCNSHFIKVLYNAFMGREYDQAGLDYWVGVLNGGEPRESAFNGYVASEEFTDICRTYGILRGEPNAQGNTGAIGRCPLDMPAPTPMATSYEIGDRITMGYYGGEEMSWIVIDKDEFGDYELLSEYIIDFRYMDENDDPDVTWETCTMRRWLNNDFLTETFTSSEQSRILTTEVEARVNPFYQNDENFEVDPGNNTSDRVYLLDVTEVCGMNSDVRVAYMTRHAMDVLGHPWCYDGQPHTYSWATRTPAISHDIYMNVDSDSKFWWNITPLPYGVRPAMWINVYSGHNMADYIGDASFVIDRETNLCHAVDCRHVPFIDEENFAIAYCSLEELISLGEYSPCEDCLGQ